jgi:hypothetical protein
MELVGKKELEKYKKKIMPFVQVSKVSKFLMIMRPAYPIS